MGRRSGCACAHRLLYSLDASSGRLSNQPCWEFRAPPGASPAVAPHLTVLTPVLTAYVAGPGGKTQIPRGTLGHRPPARQVANVASADMPPHEPSAVATLSAPSLQQPRPGYGKCPVLWSGNADCTQVRHSRHLRAILLSRG